MRDRICYVIWDEEWGLGLKLELGMALNETIGSTMGILIGTYLEWNLGIYSLGWEQERNQE